MVGSIPSGKQKGAPRGYTKWEVFIGRRRVGQGSKRKERIVSGPSPFLGEGQGLPCRFPLLPLGEGELVAHVTDDLSDVG